MIDRLSITFIKINREIAGYITRVSKKLENQNKMIKNCETRTTVMRAMG